MTENQPRVLVIDDSEDIHQLLKVRLRGEGMTLLHATDPVQGLVLARSLIPDLILLDVDMPTMTGLDACRALKADGSTSHVPVIFLTGSSSVADRVAGLDAGAVDYITKPFDPGELRARVRATLRTKRYQDLLSLRAQLDALTGLRNRAYFDTRLADEVQASRRFGRRLALILLDLDHFKAINDQYGHPFGDRVLQRVGDLLLASGKVTDAPCRYGGEEFGIVLTETGYVEGLAAAERIRSLFASSSIQKGPHEVTFTASLGVVATDAFPLGGALTADSMLRAADRALYVAKQQGRNQVVGADQSEAFALTPDPR